MQSIIHTGEYIKLQEILIILKKLQPNDRDILIKLGQISLKLNNFIGGKWYYRLAQKIDDKDEFLLIRITELCLQLNRYDEAEKTIKKGQKIGKKIKQEMYEYFLYKIYFENCEFNKALKVIKNLAQLHPNKTKYHIEYIKVLEIIILMQKKQKQKNKQKMKSIQGKIQCDACKKIKNRIYYWCKCGKEIYCSTKCQKKAWISTHRKDCTERISVQENEH